MSLEEKTRNKKGNHKQSPGKENLMMDRDQYIKYLEGKLEAISDSCLEVRSFSDQIDQMRAQLARLEARTTYRSHCDSCPITDSSSLSINSTELDIIKERLFHVEERLDKRRPAITLPNPSLDDIWDRLDEVEEISTKLAEDSLGAVESVNSKLNSMEERLSLQSQTRISATEARLDEKVNEGIDKISNVLRKLVTVQKHMSDRYKSLSPRGSHMRSFSPSDRKQLVEDLYHEIDYLNSLN